MDYFIGDVIEISIGSNLIPQMIKIGKGTCKKKRKEIEILLREYQDVFGWSYNDLKVFNKDIIQHTIPLGCKSILIEVKKYKSQVSTPCLKGIRKDACYWNYTI